MQAISCPRNKLREIRILLGITQTRFSSFIGISKRTLCKWENEPEPPVDGQLHKALYSIGINPFYLYYDEQLFRDGYDLSKVWKLVSELK